MKRLVLPLAALLCLLIVQTGCSQEMKWSAVKTMIESAFPEVHQISTDSLATRLADADAPRPLLFDTRNEDEFAVSSLQGAIRLDPETTDFAFLDTLARDTPIITYCSVGYRSSEIADRMRKAGFTNVSNLEGSIFRWANEGRPIFREGAPVREVHPFDTVWGSLLNEDLHPKDDGG